MRIQKKLILSSLAIFVVFCCISVFSFPRFALPIKAQNESPLVLEYSSFFGGSDLDKIEDIITDSEGNWYILGSTSSKDLPTRNALQVLNAGNTDAFLAKLAPDFSVIWLTYIGGELDDFGISICMSPDETTIYATGYSNSVKTFLPGSTQILKDNNVRMAGWCGFLVSVTNDGKLQSSILIGGSNEDGFFDIECNESNIYIVGHTSSSKIFPKTPSSMYEYKGSTDGIIIALNRSNMSLAWYSFLGGESIDQIHSITLSDNNIYLTGTSFSDDYPLKNSVLKSKKACDFSIVYSRFDLNGKVELSTYLNAGMWSEGLDIQVDSDNNVYICGFSKNYDESFEFTQWYTNKNDPGDISFVLSYVTKIDSNGNSIWTTGFTGSSLSSLEISEDGNIYATGKGLSSFPITENALQKEIQGIVSPVLVELSTDGKNIFSTWFGGHEDKSFPEKSWGIALNPISNQIGIVGQTTAVDFPITDDAELKENLGSLSSFIVIFAQ